MVQRGSFKERVDKLFKYAIGASPLPPMALDDAFDIPKQVDHLVMHNMPWLGGWAKDRWPRAVRTLYIHNVILRGVPRHSAARALNKFHRLAFVSTFLRDEFVDRLGLHGTDLEGRMVVIPNAVRGDAVFPNRVPDIDVVFVGRVVPEKGVDILLRAAALSTSRWRIKVVGGKYFERQPALDKYETMVREFSEAHQIDVEFTGPVSPDEVLDYLSRAKVAVVPSVWQEPAGLALLEAMSSPAAAVASAVGGMTEVGAEGGVMFVPPGDARALEHVVNRLLSDQALRKSTAREGVIAVARWTWADSYRTLVAK
jgi:glycosyltransferase involved in cell wall biosynthesis